MTLNNWCKLFLSSIEVLTIQPAGMLPLVAKSTISCVSPKWAHKHKLNKSLTLSVLYTGAYRKFRNVLDTSTWLSNCIVMKTQLWKISSKAKPAQYLLFSPLHYEVPDISVLVYFLKKFSMQKDFLYAGHPNNQELLLAWKAYSRCFLFKWKKNHSNKWLLTLSWKRSVFIVLLSDLYIGTWT